MKYSRTRAGDVNELLLIKTSLSAKAGELTGVFDGTSELTKNCLDFIMHSVMFFATNSMNDVETLISLDFPAIEASKHSIARPKTSRPLTSPRTLWPTLKPWFAPYPTSNRRTRLTRLSDARNKVDARFSKAFKENYRQQDQDINRTSTSTSTWHASSVPGSQCFLRSPRSARAATTTPRRGLGEAPLSPSPRRRPWPGLAVNKHC